MVVIGVRIKIILQGNFRYIIILLVIAMIVMEEKDNDELEGELIVEGEPIITPKMANESIELVDQLLNEIVFSDVSKKFLSKVRCANWNKLTKDERIDLYAKYGRYISDVLGEELVCLQLPYFEKHVLIHENTYQ